MSQHEQPGLTLPEATKVLLPGRGTTLVWDSGMVAGSTAPPLLLLHGWNIDAPANFGYGFHALAAERRVVMYDHHGHGHGVRPSSRFTLEDAATDALTILDSLGIEQAILVGYSMGGAIAQLLSRSNPERVAGVVLMATTDRFSDTKADKRSFGALRIAANLVDRLPEPVQRVAFKQISTVACLKYPKWILEIVQRGEPVALLDAGAALGTFDSSPWVGDLTAPVAYVYTARDTVVAPASQLRLAESAGSLLVHSVDAGHELPILDDPRFSEAIQHAVTAVSAAADTTLGSLPNSAQSAN